MASKNTIRTNGHNNKIYFHTKEGSNWSLDKKRVKDIGLGLLAATTAVAFLTTLKTNQDKSNNPPSYNREATLTILPGGSNYGAAELIASAEGITKDLPDYNSQLQGIEANVVSQEGKNGAAPLANESYPNIYVPVDSTHLSPKITQMSGYGAKLQFKSGK